MKIRITDGSKPSCQQKQRLYQTLLSSLLLVWAGASSAESLTGVGPFILSAPVNASGVQWFKDGNPLAGEVNNSLTVDSKGVYWVDFADNSPGVMCDANSTDGYAVVLQEGDTANTQLNGPAGMSNYQWYKNGSAIVGATTANLTLSANFSSVGQYYLTYASASCNQTSEKFTVYFKDILVALTVSAPTAAPGNDATPTFVGTGKPGAIVVVKNEAGGEICQATAATDGSWSCTATAALPEGENPLTVTQTYPSGSVSPSLPLTVTVDTTPPTISGNPVANNSKPMPLLSGVTNAPNGATVTLKDSSDNTVCTATVAAGAWSCTPTSNLPDGNNALTANVADALGNVGTSAPFTVNVNSNLKDFHYLFENSLKNVDPDTKKLGTNILEEVDYTNEAVTSFFEDDLSANCPGVTKKKVYHFADNAGLQFNSGAGSQFGDYTVSAMIRFTPLTGGWTRVIDFSDGQKDTGIYALGNNLNFFPNGNVGPANTFQSNRYTFLTLTRNGATGIISVYYENQKVATYNDSAGNYKVPTSGNIIFARDNLPGTPAPDEGGPGNIAYVRVANYEATPEQVTESFNNLCKTIEPPTKTPPTIAINTSISANDVINAAEAGADVVVSGTTTDAEAGQIITVTLNGKTYTTPVLADGTWTKTIPAADITALPDGAVTIKADVTDTLGNAAPQASHEIAVDKTAPLAPILTEPSATPTNDTTPAFIGTGEPGATVTVKDGNGVTVCSAVVDASNNWTCTATNPLPEGANPVTLIQVDVAGNTSPTIPATVTVDITAPVINGTEISNNNNPQPTLSGTTDAPVGATVSVKDEGGDSVCSATVGADGKWSCVSAVTLPDGDNALTASVADAAGNIGTSEPFTISVDTQLPSIAIDAVAGDNILNAAEASTAVTLTGVTTDAEIGRTITLTLNDKTYTTTILAGNIWSVVIPADDIAALPEGANALTANVSDASGNAAPPATSALMVDKTAPTLVINAIAGDDKVNAAEAGAAVTVSGTSTGVEANQNVTVMLNGKPYLATVATDGTWSATIPVTEMSAVAEGTAEITADVSDVAGNPANQASRSIDVDKTAPTVTAAGVPSTNNTKPLLSGTSDVGAGGVIAINTASNTAVCSATVQADGSWSCEPLNALPEGDNTLTASAVDKAGNLGTVPFSVVIDTTAPILHITAVSVNDFINAAEAGADVAVTGSSSGLEAGRAVTLDLNGKTYTATVAADGSWEATIPAADAGVLAEGGINLIANTTDAAGNAASPASHSATVDKTAPTILGQDIGNTNNPTPAMSGTTTAGAGQIVSVTDSNGNPVCSATVDADGVWECTPTSSLPSQTNTLTATVTDPAGNPVTDAFMVKVDTGLPSIILNAIAVDNTITAAEAAAPIVVSGTTDAEAGQVVTVNLNGKTYEATVKANGQWSTNIPAEDAQALADGTVALSVEVKDAAGNAAPIVSRELTVDQTGPSLAMADVPSTNDTKPTLSGTTDAAAGALVTVKDAADATVCTATVQANGTWSCEAQAALPEGEHTLTASTTDALGNPSKATSSIVIDLTPPVLTVDAISVDDRINTLEATAPVLVTGGSSGLEAGRSVTLSLNNKTYTTTVDADGKWGVNIPAADIAALPEGENTLVADSTDVAGNAAVPVPRALSVDKVAPTLLAQDVSDTNDTTPLLSGTTNAGEGQPLTIKDSNGNTVCSTVVAADNTWACTPEDNLPSDTLTLTAQVTDAAGNVGSDTFSVSIDTGLPSISIDPVATDNRINKAEAEAAVLVQGTTDADFNQALTLKLGGKTYTTKVGTGGRWAVTLPAADVSSLADGTLTLTVDVKDKAGNAAPQASRDLVIDNTAPVLTANDVTANSNPKPLLSGTTDLPPGTSLSVKDGAGQELCSAVTNADGSWSCIPLMALPEGESTLTVTAVDPAGNSGSDTFLVLVDITAPILTVDAVAVDDLVNAAEADADVVVTGTATDLESGREITLSVNGKTYATPVAADGSWSVTLPAADANGLVDGAAPWLVTASDAAGNAANAERMVTVDKTAPVITAVNIAYSQDPRPTLSGTSDTGLGATVTVKNAAGDVICTANVAANGTWSCVPTADLPNGNLTLIASVADAAGNTGSIPFHVVVNNAPVFTPPNTVTFMENGTGVVLDVEATPNTGLTFRLIGGVDDGKFSIDPVTGELRFLAAPDFEKPGDVNRDNAYIVGMEVCDDKAGCSQQIVVVTVTNDTTEVQASVTLQVRGFLQGAYSSTDGMMHDKLRAAGAIPTAQPYASHFAYAGAEATTAELLATTGADAPVDWVLVEVRDVLNPAIRVAAKAALIQRDGDVVDPQTGSTNLKVEGVDAGMYQVSLRHRNHLGVMGAAPLALSVTSTLVDFTLPTTSVAGNNARLEGDGVSLLWAGDANFDDSIISSGNKNDTNVILASVMFSDGANNNVNYRLEGYYTSDLNLDGVTLYAGPSNDVNVLLGNILLHPGNDKLVTNYIIIGTLPK